MLNYVQAVQHPHIPHVDASSEIQRLQLSASLKRKAEEDDAPLRQIFNDVSRSAGEAAEHVSFAELESTMYKRRRRLVGHSRSYRHRPAMLTPSSATVAMRNLTVARFTVDSSTLMHTGRH